MKNKDLLLTLHPHHLHYRSFKSNHFSPKPPVSNHRRKRMTELPAVSQYVKPKVVLFYKNGDRNFRGSHVTVTQRRFRNFDNLLNELTRITNLAQGARYIFTPDSGTRVKSLDELTDGKSYVCGSYPKLKKINYDHAPDGSKTQKKTNRNFIPVQTTPKLKYEDESKPNNIKPKIVHIIRNGVGINRKVTKILLNRRTAQTYEQVLTDITATVGVAGSGFVRRLYNENGKLIVSLSELFGEDDVFIAVGSEKFRTSDIPVLLEEADLEQKKRSPIPSPPKSQPQKAKRKMVKNNVKTIPLSNLKKLPSIGKRPEPDGESFKNESIDEQQTPVAKTEHSEPNKSFEEIIKGFMKEEKSISSCSPKVSDSGLKHSSLTSINKDRTDSVIKIDSANSNDEPKVLSSPTNKEQIPDKLDSREVSSVLSKCSEYKNNSIVLSDFDDKNSESSKSVNEEDSKTVNHEVKQDELQEKESEDLNNLLNIIEKRENAENTYPEPVTKVFDHSKEIENYYDIGKKLGDGNFAVVHEVSDKTSKKLFAMKVIEAAKMEGKLVMLNNEIRIQRSCNHPNIVQFYHDMHSPTKIYLIMELVSGGDFFDLIANNVSFDELDASGYMRDLCSGLDYMHQRDIVHRDIKPENLMVYENNGQIMLKIADFGLAMKVTTPIFTICGTPTYVAPEILTEEGYGLEVDVWAAGVILYIMLCGFPPFRSANRKQTELFDMIEKGEFEFLAPYWDDVSSAAKDLISKILIIDRSKRVTAKQIFNHEWIVQFGLHRNNTFLELSPRKNKKFKTTAKGIQSLQRMKMLLKVERQQFIEVKDNQSNKPSPTPEATREMPSVADEKETTINNKPNLKEMEVDSGESKNEKDQVITTENNKNLSHEGTDNEQQNKQTSHQQSSENSSDDTTGQNNQLSDRQEDGQQNFEHVSVQQEHSTENKTVTSDQEFDEEKKDNDYIHSTNEQA